MYIIEKQDFERDLLKGIIRNRNYHIKKEAIENTIAFYQNNKIICEKAYNYYQEFNENQKEYTNEPERINKSTFCKHIHKKRALVLTANPIERGILTRWLSEKDGSLSSYIVNNITYDIYNTTDNISIVHVYTARTGEESARLAINHACHLFTPSAICLLGICYGFDRKKHSIGSVLLSEKIDLIKVNYRDPKSLDDPGLEIQSEYSKAPSDTLITILRDRIIRLMFYNILSDNTVSPVTVKTDIGIFLSLNSLISNSRVKKAFVDQYGFNRSRLVGGEMEGGGVLKSDIVQKSNYTNWLILKGICDWGEFKNNIIPNDKEKSKLIKDSLQAYAMSNACGVFEKVLKDLCEVRNEKNTR